jgi:hypothetical protein
MPPFHVIYQVIHVYLMELMQLLDSMANHDLGPSIFNRDKGPSKDERIQALETKYASLSEKVESMTNEHTILMAKNAELEYKCRENEANWKYEEQTSRSEELGLLLKVRGVEHRLDVLEEKAKTKGRMGRQAYAEPLYNPPADA